MAVFPYALVRYSDILEIIEWCCVLCSGRCTSVEAYKAHVQEHDVLSNTSLSVIATAKDKDGNCIINTTNFGYQAVVSCKQYCNLMF